MTEWVSFLFFLLSSFLLIILLLFQLYLFPSTIKRGHGPRQQRDRGGRKQQRGNKHINNRGRTGRDSRRRQQCRTVPGRGGEQSWSTGMPSFLFYSLLFFLSFSFFMIISFSVECDNRREGRGVPTRAAMIKQDRTGGRQAQRVCILSLLFFLLSSFLLLTFVISFFLRTTKTGGMGWDRTGRGNAGCDSNVGWDRRQAGGRRRRQKKVGKWVTKNMGTAEAEERTTKSCKRKLRGGDGGGRRDRQKTITRHVFCFQRLDF